MIMMPHSRPGHRSSSQARQTSGTPQAPASNHVSPSWARARVRYSSSAAELPVTVREIALAERRILGSFYGSARTQIDFPRLIALWRSGQLDLARLVTRRIALGEVDSAFEAMRTGAGIRTVIDLDR